MLMAGVSWVWGASGCGVQKGPGTNVNVGLWDFRQAMGAQVLAGAVASSAPHVGVGL